MKNNISSKKVGNVASTVNKDSMPLSQGKRHRLKIPQGGRK